MAKGVSYAEAVKLLGGQDSKLVAGLDRLAGGLLLGAAAGGLGLALSLFGPKAELVRLSKELVAGVTRRLHGAGRTDRTDRLVAAHAVVVLTGFFEALREIDLPFDVRDLEITRDDQAAMMSPVWHTKVPIPTPQSPYEATRQAISGLYRELAVAVSRFVQGLAVWDRLDETKRARFGDIVHGELPDRATARYDELFRRLAGDFPEFAYWANLTDHQATRAEIRQLSGGLAGVEEVLLRIASGRAPDVRRQALARSYQAVLDEPLLPLGDVPAELRLPPIGDAYVNPDFRVARVEVANRLADESWWEAQPVREDLPAFLLGHLTAPQATQVPLMVLGQPGSGKSMLTQIIAARLPPSEFLTVRVALRDVPAEAELQDQIEHAVRKATGESLPWPDLVASAGDALPVVLLDGFDELLQATGVTQSDYLDKVATFQRREAVLRRQVAVLVTSRTAVADRARPVAGMIALRIEPFREAHVEQWVRTWNSANAVRFEELRVRPLAVDRVLAHPALASQPLLLAMLAIYDTDGNPLQRDDVEFSQTELYERLLVRFAQREVSKSQPGLSDEQLDHAVGQELLRLSVVAFAMFNRGRLWCTEAELDADLPVLFGTQHSREAGFRARLTAAQVALGRFFFIHHAQAIRDNQRQRTYEFLHATFGEYLIGRLLLQVLRDLMSAATSRVLHVRSSPPDDDFLYVLLSFTPLTIRETVISFLREQVCSLTTTERNLLQALLLEVFHRSLDPRHPSDLTNYRPVRMAVPARYAAYSANLLVITVLCGQVTTQQLFPDAAYSVDEWKRVASLWHSQLPTGGWHGLIGLISVHREWNGDVRVARLRPTDDEQLPAVDIDPYWSHHIVPSDPFRQSGWFGWVRSDMDLLRCQSQFLCDPSHDTLVHALEPLRTDLGSAVVSFFALAGNRTTSAAHALISLWLASSGPADAEALAAAHELCLDHAITGFAPYDTSTITRFRSVYLHQLAKDLPRLPESWLTRAATRITDDSLTWRDTEELTRLTNEIVPGLLDRNS